MPELHSVMVVAGRLVSKSVPFCPVPDFSDHRTRTPNELEMLTLSRASNRHDAKTRTHTFLHLSKPLQLACSGRIARSKSNQASAFERCVGTVLIDGLKGSGGQLHADKTSQFWHPDSLIAQVWRESTLHFFDMIQPDAALLFCEAAMMNFIALLTPGSGDAANHCHNAGIGSADSPEVKDLSEIRKSLPE